MSDQYRRLAVFVDHPGDSHYVWIILESSDDPAVWLDLETGDETFESWIDAHNAGNAALLGYVDDEDVGPVEAGQDDEDPDEALP